VILLTAQDDVGSKVGGLEAGADDYVTKPFSIEELAARVRARLRSRAEEEMALKVGSLTLDVTAHRAFIEGREIRLSARELELLAAFMRHQGQVLSRPQLLKMVWDIEFDPGSNVVDVHVAALRRKIGPELLETIRGLGYRFVAPIQRAAEGETL
jgi:DNA-binding response OmpR family regulator